MSMTLHWTHFLLARKSMACMKMAGLKEKFYTLPLKFVYITFCLLMELDYVAAEDFNGIDLILL